MDGLCAPPRPPLSLTRDDYTIGWISALTVESAAAAAMLDIKHKALQVAPGDTNTYILGAVGEHNVVMACINEASGLSAHIVARNLNFHNVRYVLMVGIDGGILAMMIMKFNLAISSLANPKVGLAVLSRATLVQYMGNRRRIQNKGSRDMRQSYIC